MFARSALSDDFGGDTPTAHADVPERAAPSADDPGWLTLQQAACELGVSESTVRRAIRTGRLRNRIIPRRGGFAYLVYLPESRHAEAEHSCGDTNDHAQAEDHAEQLRLLEEHVDMLAKALRSALRMKQMSTPTGRLDRHAATDDPYARYRWLVRRRRWWPR